MSTDAEDDTPTADDAREIAERLLARRGHSRSELTGKLLDRDVPRELAETVCDGLEERGLLDDAEFAAHQARILRDKNWGPLQIRRKLLDHGVSEADCDAALEEVGGDSVWLEHCYDRFQSEFGRDADEMDRSRLGKAYRHLERRGFPGWMARRILLDGYEPEQTR